MRIKIQDMPTDSVAQWVEHRRDKPWARVRILGSVRCLIYFVAFFLSLQPWRGVETSNFDRGLRNSAMLIQIATDKHKKLLS